MNINDFKYIVATGCSYGDILKSILIEEESYINEYHTKLKKELADNNIKKYDLYSNNIIFIDVPMRSQGTTWQADSMIYVISNLLSMGVLSENIYSIVEWSQWSRSSETIPQIFYDTLDILSLNKKSYNIGHPSCEEFQIRTNSTNTNFSLVKQKLTDSLNIKSFKEIGINFSYIDGEYYITPSHLDSKSVGNIIGIEWEYFINYLQELDSKKSVDSKIKDYLNNIIKTQNFLKQNNINYNFFHMQSCMSGWYYDNKILKHNLTHNLDYINNHSNPQFTSNKTDIEVVWSKYNYIFNQIDFNNIWQYNENGYRRGGVDEYSYSKYGETSYTSLYDRTFNSMIGKDEHKLIQIPKYGSHPAMLVYKTLWNQITTNCKFFRYTKEYLDFINHKIFEDINYKDITKNGLFISKNKYKEFMKTCKS
jgi:hypothetical protein